MGEVNEDARRALLDELDVVEAADYRAVVSSNRWLRDRAERAERERDEWREALDEAKETRRRYHEALNKIGYVYTCPTCDADPVEIARAALSADADADAEPERCGTQDPYGVAGPCHEPAGHSGWHCAEPSHYDPQNCTHECNGPRDCTGTPTGCRWCGCSRCDVPPGEEPSRAEDCGHQVGCPYDPPCQRHGDPDRQEMLRQLDVALHGDTWARPKSPSVVWRDLLGEVVSLARRTGGSR